MCLGFDYVFGLGLVNYTFVCVSKLKTLGPLIDLVLTIMLLPLYWYRCFWHGVVVFESLFFWEYDEFDN